MAAGRAELRRAMEQMASSCAPMAEAAAGGPTPVGEYAAVMAAACDQEKNSRDRFGDGDQSLLRHDGPQDAIAQALKNVWAQGADFFALLQSNGLSECMMSCVTGRPELLAPALERARAAGGEALFHTLERRETMLRITPLHGAIMGALQIGRQHGADHIAVARLLLDAGARPDAKDIAGYTPMHRCANAMANELTLEIGMLLVERRADSNMFNRFGDPPLIEAVMGNRPDCAALLCEGGADPMLPSHFHGICPFKMNILDMALDLKEVFSHAISRQAVTGSFRLQGASVTLHNLSRHDLNGRQGVCGRLNPAKRRYAVTLPSGDDGSEQTVLIALKNIRVHRGLEGQRVVLKGLSKEQLNGRRGVCGAFQEEKGRWAVTLDGESVSIAVKQANLEVLKENFVCTHCGKEAPEMDKCGKCLKARFCSKACLQHGYGAHKEQCLLWRAALVTVDPRTCGPEGGQTITSWSDPANRTMDVGKNPLGKSKTTVVKVSTPAQPDGNLLVYNKKRDLYFMIAPGKCDQHAAIFQSVSDGGIVGRKAYFNAHLSRDGLVTINYLEHLPPENW
eukprot:Tamp_07232.p1 GENE.Tamp_07232~~Tamp_07232.p1  ORF type:complete len:566 (-),score=139.09 Tamp_07232:562-2259(-)